jgi:hypothetical protein
MKDGQRAGYKRDNFLTEFLTRMTSTIQRNTQPKRTIQCSGTGDPAARRAIRFNGLWGKDRARRRRITAAVEKTN